jgi:glycosyltransferase involved in cell wall biosynthesis
MLSAGIDTLPLTIVGLSPDGRAAVQAGAAARGIGDLVTLKPWLSNAEFEQQFTSAALVVFPSDYEGFGLPAVEAMRLGIPVVVTPDPALLEVTAGLATVMDGWDAKALAAAVQRARATTAAGLGGGIAQASTFTWRHTAGAVRDALVACTE